MLPFVCKFDYGQNQNRYWCYDTMVLQLEDVIDTLTVSYGNTYDFVFYLDHSSGHDRLRPDGLNANEMNKLFGGNQSKKRTTTIENPTYLGPHQPILNVGDVYA